MHIYFSGIGGSGLSPLAHLSIDCGHNVSGSDREFNSNLIELQARGVNYSLEESQIEIAQIHQKNPIDWIVITSALPSDHPHIVFAKQHNIKISKRHDLINLICKQKNLKLIAIAGTHGKTTTTGMFVWLFKQLVMPVSYLIGTNISYGRSGQYALGSQYMIYECDEFDRNFLNFDPEIAVIPSLDFDHPDTYKNDLDYVSAFVEFFSKSQKIVAWESTLEYIKSQLSIANRDITKELISQEVHFLEESKDEIKLLCDDAKFLKLAGKNTRKNAILVLFVMCNILGIEESIVMDSINGFVGIDRRFQKLATNLYSDYGHHPVEIDSTLQMAKEVLTQSQKLILVYQPHQNIRQHQQEVQEGYKNCFENADKVYWLPTYLSRENSLPILSNKELLEVSGHNNDSKFISSELSKSLQSQIQKELKSGNLVIVMGAGSIDTWAKENLC